MPNIFHTRLMNFILGLWIVILKAIRSISCMRHTSANSQIGGETSVAILNWAPGVQGGDLEASIYPDQEKRGGGGAICLICLSVSFVILWHLRSRKIIGNGWFVCFLILSIWCLFGNVCHAGKKYFIKNEGLELFFLSFFVRICIDRTKEPVTQTDIL